MNRVPPSLRQLWKPKAFSPMAYVRRALIVTFVYTVSEFLGLREYTTFLSGTTASTSLSWQLVAVLGCFHLVLYFGFILLVPIWLIAAGLLAAWNSVRAAQRRRRPARAGGENRLA